MARLASSRAAQFKPLVEERREPSAAFRLFVVGMASLGAAATLFVFREHMGQGFMLGLLGILAMVGVFYLFASVIGFIHIGSRASNDDIGTDFLNSLSDAICITDNKQTVIYANRAYGKVTGIENAADIQSLEQLLSRHEDASNALYRLANSALQTGEAEEEFRLPNGLRPNDTGPKWFRASVRKVSGPGGNKNLRVWQLSDISEEREAQERVFRELQQAIDHLDRAPVGFFSVDGNGLIQYINATLAGWLGIDLTEFLSGRVGLDDLFASDQAHVLSSIKAEPGASRTAILDLDMRKQDGESLPVQLLHRVYGGVEGTENPARTIVINRADTSDVAIGGDSSDVRFNRFFNSTPMAIAALDVDGRILRTNMAFATLFASSLDADALQRRVRFDTLLQADDQERFERAFDAAKANRANIDPFDAVLPREGEPQEGVSEEEDVTHLRVFVNAVARIAGVDTAVDGSKDTDEDEIALVYIMDMTEQKALENQMAQGQKMQAVGQLAGGIAHDFNNVLTAIIMASDLLLTSHRPSDPSFPDIMNIKQNANRAASLVRQLLAFSRRQTLRPEVLSITDVLADLRMLLSRLIGNNVELSIEHGRDIWPVKVDLGQFEQVIVNLCVNARDAMPDGGSLQISTHNISDDDTEALNYRGLQAQDYVRIDIADTGTGIEPDVLKKIFEPFFTTKEVGKGTGLGLSMVYGIVKQTGGHIYADSVVGEGTTFRIFLPRHVPGEAEFEETETAVAPPPEKRKDLSGNETVLLVEDEDAVRMGGVRALESRGYTVHEAGSGVEAMEVMEELGDEIDIIVSDVVMPEMDGPSLLREVRKTHPDIKFIFVSGYAQDAFAKNLPEGAQFGFLPKPFSLKQLATTVKETLESED